jgi:hypothetical protein
MLEYSLWQRAGAWSSKMKGVVNYYLDNHGRKWLVWYCLQTKAILIFKKENFPWKMNQLEEK